MGKNATNRVSRQLTDAREQSLIPWSWIVDETRAPERVSTWESTDEIIRAAVDSYRRDYWQHQMERVEVWSEKGTLRGTLAPVLQEYGVTFRVMHGYGSATAIHDIARESSAERSLTAFYVGDFDCSGMHMSEVDLPQRLEEYGANVVVERIALTADDIRSGLPSFDAATKTGDPRYRWFVDRYGGRCWEVDAMPPPDLRERVEFAIRDTIDFEEWEHSAKIEQAEVASMRAFAQKWKETTAPRG